MALPILLEFLELLSAAPLTLGQPEEVGTHGENEDRMENRRAGSEVLGGLMLCCISVAFVHDDFHPRTHLETRTPSNRDSLRLLELAAAPTNSDLP